MRADLARLSLASLWVLVLFGRIDLQLLFSSYFHLLISLHPLHLRKAFVGCCQSF